jgi:hypothetical protein
MMMLFNCKKKKKKKIILEKPVDYATQTITVVVV